MDLGPSLSKNIALLRMIRGNAKRKFFAFMIPVFLVALREGESKLQALKFRSLETSALLDVLSLRNRNSADVGYKYLFQNSQTPSRSGT